MKIMPVIVGVVLGCLILWALLSYQNGRAMSPPLDPFGRGEWYYLAAEYDQATSAYQEAIKGGLDALLMKEAKFKVARSLHEAKRYAQAIRAYEEFMRAYPQSEEANRAQGHVEWIRQNSGKVQ